MAEDPEYFKVEEIRDKRGPPPEYFCKWKDYDDGHNSWEPAENLSSCLHLIDAFEQKQVRFFPIPTLISHQWCHWPDSLLLR